MRKSLAIALLCIPAAAVFSTAFSLPVDRTTTVTGTITKVQASERTVAVTLTDGSEARFVWNADTKISGILTPGAKATIRYGGETDGRKIALQITVARS